MKVHSLAEPSWVMCHLELEHGVMITPCSKSMLYKYKEQLLMRCVYEMIIAKSIISYPTPFVEHILVNYNYRTLYETSFIVCLVFLHSIHL